MYHSESGINPKLHTAGIQAASRRRIGATIYFIGLTSLLTDISAEMVASILPVYLFSVLRLSPFEYGLIDGFYNGSTALFRLLAAYCADFGRKHKTVACIGYGLSMLARCALPFAGFAGWLSVALIVLIDRIGKGIRTAPRDALIAAHTEPDTLGAAFGVHRAMDAVGAIIGPLLAAGILLYLPGRFDFVFVASIGFAFGGLIVIGLFVQPAVSTEHASSTPSNLPLKAAFAAMAAPPFLLAAIAGTLLSLFTLSDNMIYLGLQRGIGFDPARIPLLFVATATVFMSLAIPIGRLADRYGPIRVFLFGHLSLALVYCLSGTLVAYGSLGVILAVVLLGAYYAATDGVIAALATRHLPAEARATGLACIATLFSLGRMGSSILYGWLWESTNQQHATILFGLAMLITLVFAAIVARRLQQRGRAAFSMPA